MSAAQEEEGQRERQREREMGLTRSGAHVLPKVGLELTGCGT